MTIISEERAITARHPKRLFPLIRRVSCRLTPFLLELPVTANHITVAATAIGLAGAWCFLQGGMAASLSGAILFIISSILDNCDGEVARLKGIESRFGDRLGDFGGWVVHAALFVALGINAAQTYGHEMWSWFGYITAAGATMNYGLTSILKVTPADRVSVPSDLSGTLRWSEKAIYVFRALMRADFCFILLVLVVFDLVWVLLPMAAVGAQIYWTTALYEKARKFHV